MRALLLTLSAIIALGGAALVAAPAANADHWGGYWVGPTYYNSYPTYYRTYTYPTWQTRYYSPYRTYTPYYRTYYPRYYYRRPFVGFRLGLGL
jgi:hypothetical protein